MTGKNEEAMDGMEDGDADEYRFSSGLKKEFLTAQVVKRGYLLFFVHGFLHSSNPIHLFLKHGEAEDLVIMDQRSQQTRK